MSRPFLFVWRAIEVSDESRGMEAPAVNDRREYTSSSVCCAKLNKFFLFVFLLIVCSDDKPSGRCKSGTQEVQMREEKQCRKIAARELLRRSKAGIT